MQEGIKVTLSPEIIGNLWGLPITNTLLMSWAVIIVLGVLAYVIGSNVKLLPGRLQTLLEWLFSFVYDYITETLESRDLARKFFPLLLTIFLFIFTANMLEFTPGIGSVGFFSAGGGPSFGGQEFIPLFRSANTDLNATLALAIISFFVIEFTGVFVIGAAKYAGKFLNFHSVMGFVVGIIELFSEIARLISFSFRLFGNIFAGEVLILVVGHFVPYFLPVPLMIFEVFVGFIQAAIFALLTLFFIKIAITEPH
ncbi:MAG: F0F1 ATP synthase subunit A [bacterium]|nr:F0F1 ATP synthase subunit A [bacterium]